MIKDADITELVFIARMMRRRDREEMAATRGARFDPDDLAIEAHRSEWKKVAYGRHDLPVLALGARTLYPGVVTVWGFGTDRYREAIVEMTKYARAVIVPELLAAGMHRAQCLVHPNNRASQRWLGKLGFGAEARLRDMGTHREDLLLFAWVLRDHQNAV